VINFSGKAQGSIPAALQNQIETRKPKGLAGFLLPSGIQKMQ
jgi:hypothetical protein